MPTRYDRQVPLIGEEGQRRLSESVVGIAGCGGLGTTVVTNLASAGVGHLVIADGDVPDVTNLNRQFVYREGSEDEKSVLLAQWAREVNPGVDVTSFPERLTDGNIGSVLGKCGILVDCLDSLDARRLLNRYAVRSGKTLVHAGVTGYTGQATVVVPGRTPCLECLYRGVRVPPSAPPSLGAMVTHLASLEALQVVQIVTGTGSPLVGKMEVVDMSVPDVSIVPVERDPSCPVCSPAGHDEV